MKFTIIENEQTPKIEDWKPVETQIKEDLEMMCKFIRFVRVRKNCAGLAANQVKINKERIMKPFFAIKNSHSWEIVIQPKIIKYYGKKELKIESCLSWVGGRIPVERYPYIEVEYFSLNGEKKRCMVHGFLSQVWQHEYDHIMGVKEHVAYHGNKKNQQKEIKDLNKE